MSSSSTSGLMGVLWNSFSKNYRDDVEAVRGIVEICPSLLAMDFPAEWLLPSLSRELNRRLGSSYLVLNMSERHYEASAFAGEVLDVQFRGHPSPPLGLLLELLLSVNAFLQSDSQNVVVVHCFRGFSRTAVFLSCYLAWTGQVAHPVDGLDMVCSRLGLAEETHILPSQKRYLNYFFRVLADNFIPDPMPRHVRGISISEIPRSICARVEEESCGDDGHRFKPFIEIWQDGKLTYTSNKDGDYNVDRESGNAPFTLETRNQDIRILGDVLIRLRLVNIDGSATSICRFAFNTSFIEADISKLSFGKRELDGITSEATSPDFFVELLIEDDLTTAKDIEDGQRMRSVFLSARERSTLIREKRASQASPLAASCDKQRAVEGGVTTVSSSSRQFMSAATDWVHKRIRVETISQLRQDLQDTVRKVQDSLTTLAANAVDSDSADDAETQGVDDKAIVATTLSSASETLIKEEYVTTTTRAAAAAEGTTVTCPTTPSGSNDEKILSSNNPITTSSLLLEDDELEPWD